MRSGIIKSTYEDTYVFAPSIYYFLQFGSTAGTDGIMDTKVLSTGQIICMVYTNSATTFAGIDVSTYTNSGANYAYGFVKIDPNLPPSGFVLGSYWINVSGKSLGGGYYSTPKMEIDGSDNIYFCIGTATTPALDVKCYGIRTSDMTLTKTADTALTACYNSHYSCKVVGSYVYVCYSNSADSYFLHCQKLNIADLTQVSQGRMTSFSNYYYAAITGDGTTLYTGAQNLDDIVKLDATPAYVTRTTLADLSNSQAKYLFNETSNIYVSGINTSGTVNRAWVYALKKDLSAFKTGWVGAFKATDPDAGGVVGHPTVLVDEVSGRLCLLWPTSKAATGALDLSWYEINPANGAEISEQWVRYNDGATIGQATKSFYTYCPPVRYDTDKYFVGGRTTGTLTGFTSGQCFLLKVDNTGKILA